MSGSARTKVIAGYVDTRREDSEPARDAVVVRSGAEQPNVVRKWHLGDVDCALFEGVDVDARPVRPASPSLPREALGLVVGYVVSGRLRVSQAGRTVDLGAGELVLYGGEAPFRVRSDVPHRYLVVHARGGAVRTRREEREAVAVRDLSEYAAANALTGLLAAVVASAEPPAGAGRHLGDAMISCLHALVTEVSGAAIGPRSAMLFEELTDWLDAHLADDALSAESLAAEHFMSARYVRKVFADNGTTVSSYVRTRRLERIRDELVQPWSIHLPVSVIAARWGYRDASVFSRAFARQFGQGPQSFRRTALTRLRAMPPRS